MAITTSVVSVSLNLSPHVSHRGTGRRTHGRLCSSLHEGFCLWSRLIFISYWISKCQNNWSSETFMLLWPSFLFQFALKENATLEVHWMRVLAANALIEANYICKKVSQNSAWQNIIDPRLQTHPLSTQMQCFPLLFKEGEMLVLDFIFVPIKEHLSLFYFKKFLYILMWFVKDKLTSRKNTSCLCFSKFYFL